MRAISECDLAEEIRTAIGAWEIYRLRFEIEGDTPPKDMATFIAHTLTAADAYRAARATRDTASRECPINVD